MDRQNLFIFNLYYYLLNLRDTLEYAIPREHEYFMLSQRKKVLTDGIESGAIGSFLKQNNENGEKIKEGLKNSIDELYGDDSTILKKDGEKVRVDNTQNIRIFELVVGNAETVRDVVYGYINFARSKNDLDESILDLVKKDEVLYRTIVALLIFREYEKSFAEFQKIMSENKGQPSPQSNYVVKNELNKLAGFLRFSRSHCHASDNKTLDLLDDVNKVIEMCEGRRDRIDNKPFKDFFSDINTRLNQYLAEVEPVWKNQFNSVLKVVVEEERNLKNSASKNEENPKA